MERDEGKSDPVEDRAESELTDVDAVLTEIGFSAEATTLTRRQAEVLLLREQGYKQATIADRLGTSRANVAGIESSARENVRKARETVTLVELLAAPVRVDVPAGTDLYDVPEMIFDACDESGIKVEHNAPELMKLISDGAEGSIEGRAVSEQLFVNVTRDGTVRVRKPE